MSAESDIKRAIRAIAGGRSVALMAAEVKRVDGDVCIVDIDGLEVQDVRLRAVEDGSTTGLRITPKEGSYVIVADLSGGRMDRVVVLGWSEVDKIEINGGELGGMVKVEELASRLNDIERDINNLKSVFAGWVPAPGDGGAVLKTATGSWATQRLSETRRGELEDDKIVH